MKQLPSSIREHLQLTAPSLAQTVLNKLSIREKKTAMIEAYSVCLHSLYVTKIEFQMSNLQSSWLQPYC